MEDKEAIESVKRGRTEDFGILVSRYSEKIYRLCLSLCGNGSEAEDAAQEAFIDAYLHLVSLSDAEKFFPWLCSIARRKAYKQIRERLNAEDLDAMSEFLPSDDAFLYETVLYRERNRRISQALKGLPETKRIVAEMFYFRSMKLSDIAKDLSLPEGTVKSRLHDAREILRKELKDMNENTENVAALEEKIKEQIKGLSCYYALNGVFDDAYKSNVKDTIDLVERLKDDKTKQYYLSTVLMYQVATETDDDKINSIKEKAYEAAEFGKNAIVITDELISKALDMEDAKEAISFINETALPRIEEFKGTPDGRYAEGALRFWRGRSQLNYDLDEAKKDFEKAAELLDKSEAYQANAVAAIRLIELIKENAHDSYKKGFCATAEGIVYNNGRYGFKCQPGFSTSDLFMHLHRYDSFFFFASVCKRTLLDLSMNPGDRIEDGNSSLECVSKDESVTVISGTFENCIHTRTTSQQYYGGYSIDIWYAQNVGIVKVTCGTEKYELAEYSVQGEGYLPFTVGNRWVYRNPDLPSYLFHSIERTVEYTDGYLTYIAISSPFTLIKDYDRLPDVDSSLYLGLADSLCDEWKLEEAIEMLKKAVRINTDEQSVRISLYGIEALSRFAEYQKKGYRFCPSSISASTVTVDESAVRYEDYLQTFGPYRLGARGRYEDRIFGIKPFRYIERFMGCLWYKNWIPGYREEKDVEDGLKLIFTVEEGGHISVPAGEFDDCRKITLRVDKPEGKDDRWYFDDWYTYTHCGVKEHWFAPGVGIVKMVSSWGEECYAECLLDSYSVPAADKNDYFPIQIGNSWEYSEPHLTEEGYRAKRIYRIASGMNGKYLMVGSQEFICLMTEEEYDKFVERSHKY